jgi:hypothetical protein
MPITRVGLVTLATGTNTGWTCAIPAGVQDNDVAFTVVGKRASGVPTAPSGQGYTLLDPVDASATAAYQWCYAAVLQAADAGTSHVWAWASTTAGASCLILRGVEPGTLLDVADPPAAGLANASSVNAPASSAPNAGDWVLWASTHAANVTHAFPATSGGNAVTREVGATAGAVGLARAEYAAAGAVAALTVTFSASGRCLAKTLVVRPAGLGPVAQRWTGSAWTATTVRRWDGAAWVPAVVKRWTGSGWA